MPKTQSIQSYLPPAIELTKTANVAFTPNRNYQATLPILVGNIVVTPEQIEELLITAGEYHAIQLVRVLDALKPLNEDAIYSIKSILEPYMVTTSGMEFPFPPESSRTVTSEVTRRGRVEPNFYFDE